jgi:hypothetical protein
VEEKMEEFVALMSLDWADRSHVGCLQAAGSEEIEVFELERKAIAIAEWYSNGSESSIVVGRTGSATTRAFIWMLYEGEPLHLSNC